MELHSWTVNEIEVLVDVYVRRKRIDKASSLRAELTRRIELNDSADQKKLEALLEKLTEPTASNLTQLLTGTVVQLFRTSRKTA